MFATIFKSKLSYLLVFLYVIVFLWWLKIFITGVKASNENYLFGFFYVVIGLIGGINGIMVVSKVWGGYKSLIGRGIIFLSLGLLGQWLGQNIWTYYNVIEKVEVPYPSLADIGYFALVPFYTLAALMFVQASGAKFSLRTISGKILAILIPLIMLLVAYILFVKDVGIDTSNPIKTFFDFGYPLGEIIPVSIAIFTLYLSTNFLGGKMKSRILYLIFAFSFQFLTEYAFLYAAGQGTYYNAGINDLLYATSYAIMSIGLISFKSYE